MRGGKAPPLIPPEKERLAALLFLCRAVYGDPSTACLKSLPGPGCAPIQVARMASDVGLPGSVAFVLPLTSTRVPWPARQVRTTSWPFGMSSTAPQRVLDPAL